MVSKRATFLKKTEINSSCLNSSQEIVIPAAGATIRLVEKPTARADGYEIVQCATDTCK